MCNPLCIDFVRRSFLDEKVEGARILEVGSRDVNGTARSVLVDRRPAEYIGVDIADGPGVDELCKVEHLVDRFGDCSFDAVVSTELLEHIRDWRAAISNLKRVVRPGGIVVMTTRSRGFPLHGYPYDFWRYEPSDIRIMFADFEIEQLESDDPTNPGVLFKVRKPSDFKELDLTHYRVHSVIRNHRAAKVSLAEWITMRALAALWLTTKDRIPLTLSKGVKAFVRSWSAGGS